MAVSGWMVSVANLLGIGLETEVLKNIPGFVPCASKPCIVLFAEGEPANEGRDHNKLKSEYRSRETRDKKFKKRVQN
jgi:hypothetical protein